MRKRHPTVEIHDNSFYADPITPHERDQPKLRALLSADDTFRQYGGMKLCGEFHADYAVSWTVDGKEFYALLCFGCMEAKFYGPSGEYYHDLVRTASDDDNDFDSPIEKLLRNYDPYRRPPQPPETTGQ